MNPEQTTTSVTDDELLFFHWQDGLDAARSQQIARALQTDPTLAARFAALAGDLGLLRDTHEPAADPDFVARLSARIPREATIPEPNRQHAPRQRPRGWPMALAAGLVATIALVLGGRDPAPVNPVPPPTIAESAVDESGRLARQVAFALETSAEELSMLPEQDTAARERMVAAWISQNELFAEAARRAGDERLARTLRSFEPLLRSLQSAEPSRKDAIREQLEFEWDMMHTQLRQRTSKTKPVRT